MIPLMRPDFPDLRKVHRIFQRAHDYQFTNFGKLAVEVEDKLGLVMKGFALPVVNGTAALTVAANSLGLRGKRVLIPDFTHSGTLLGLIQAGCEPVFGGVDDKSWVLELDLAEAFHNKFDAVCVVSPFGYEVDFFRWEKFSLEYDKPIIYDLAGAWGKFPPVANPRCYSFHSTKNFGVGEGGCVVFPTKELRDSARRVTNFGTLPDRSIESLEGFNCKIDELKAATILARLDDAFEVKKRIEAKNKVLTFYSQEIKGAFLPKGHHNPSLCVLGNLPAKEIEEAGLRAGIQFKQYYPLLTHMPALREIERIYSSSEKMLHCLALPSDVSFNEAEKVVNFVNKFLEA